MISGNEGQSYVYREDVNTSASRKSKIMDPVLGEDERKKNCTKTCLVGVSRRSASLGRVNRERRGEPDN